MRRPFAFARYLKTSVRLQADWHSFMIGITIVPHSDRLGWWATIGLGFVSVTIERQSELF